MVEDAKKHAKAHVHNSQDHRHLHLEGIQETEMVGSQAPDLITMRKMEIIHKGQIDSGMRGNRNTFERESQFL